MNLLPQTSLISNANLPSHILTLIQSLSVSSPFAGIPESLKYISIKFWAELHIFAGSSNFKISWYATCIKSSMLWENHTNSYFTTLWYYNELTSLLLFSTNNELSGESTGSKSLRIFSCKIKDDRPIISLCKNQLQVDKYSWRIDLNN